MGHNPAVGVPPPAESGFSREIHWVVSTEKCSSDPQPFAFASPTTSAKHRSATGYCSARAWFGEKRDWSNTTSLGLRSRNQRNNRSYYCRQQNCRSDRIEYRALSTLAGSRLII